jgi:hypothetical protein
MKKCLIPASEAGSDEEDDKMIKTRNFAIQDEE